MTASLQNLLKEPNVQQLMNILESHGIQSRIVGGAVRDALLGLPIHDIDIAAAAPPQTISTVLSPHAHVIPTGIKHGTVTIVLKENTFEVTSLRRDIESFGRRAEVAYSTSFEEDAHRRDFTINAMYLDKDGYLYDYFDGQDDLKKGLVRFIGDPRARICEDYLRILRYFRMHVMFGKMWHQESLDACAALVQGMDILSRERVRHEFLKILAAPDSLEDIHVMAEKGILSHVVPRLGFNIKTFDQFMIQEKEHSLNIDPLYRLYALYHDQPLSHVKKEFVLTRYEHDVWQRLDSIMNSNFLVAELLYLYGQPFVEAFLCLYQAIKKESMGVHRGKLKTLFVTDFPLKASDLHPLNYTGKNLGDALKKALRHWCEEDFKPSKQDLLLFLNEDRS